MTKLFITFIFSLFAVDSMAQYAYFATKGTIDYEKVVYTKARMREMMAKQSGQGGNRGMMFGGNIDDMPESTTSNFVLKFDEIQTLMEPTETATASTSAKMPSPTVVQGGRAGGARGNQGGNFGGNRSGNSQAGARRGGNRFTDKIYFQNLKSKESELQLQLDEKVIIKDSLPEITWRFTDEFRNIAGYECRRVNGATKDSLYLIAFYSEEIPGSGGPALTGGLPGMILGLVIPEMHINYWATKVTFTNENVPKTWKDKKAKEMSSNEFFKLLSGTLFRGRGNNEAQQRRQILEQILY